MSKLNRIKQVLRNLLVEFGEVSTDGGVLIWDSEEELKIGDEVHSIDENGNEIQVEDGTYTTEDKKQIIVKDGKVVEIKDNDAEIAPENEEPANEEPQTNEDETPANEEPANDEPSTDEKDEKIAELEAKIAELEAENAELKAKVDELEKEPAAPNAEEAFENIEKTNSKADRMRQRGYKFN